MKRMPWRTFRRFNDYIPELEAREKLAESTIVSFPHLKHDSRKRLHASWVQQARIDPEDVKATRRRITGDDIRAFIGAPRKKKDKK